MLPFAKKLDRAQEPLPIGANRHQKRPLKLSSDFKHGIPVQRDERKPQYLVGPFLGVNDIGQQRAGLDTE
jgi:hypothetical protein